MNIKDLRARLPQAKVFLWILGGVFVGGLIFQLGLIVGYKKANFSYRWGENYHRNFGGPRGGFINSLRDDDLVKGHGVFGEILKIEGPVLTIKDQNDQELSVVTTRKTIVKRFQATIPFQQLNENDAVVIIGEPNNLGQIVAKFIRVMPGNPKGKTFAPRLFYRFIKGII